MLTSYPVRPMDGTMASNSDSDRPVYRRSGRVNGLRFMPAALVALLIAVGMGYCWFLAFDADLNYWLATPLILSLPVAVTAFVAVTVGHCRNRFVAVAFGVVLALVFQLAYFHFDMVHQRGPDAIPRLDRLPQFIAERMANDGLPFKTTCCRETRCTTGSTRLRNCSSFHC